MARDAQSFEEIGDMAAEVSHMIAARFGGARRGERPPLRIMLRRRGGALPRRLRKAGARLARAETLARQPMVARQMDLAGLSRDRDLLIAHLQPLGQFNRWQGRAISFAASVAFGLLVLGAAIVWLLVWRGRL